GHCLPLLHLAAGRYDLAEKFLRQELSEVEDVPRVFADHGDVRQRQVLLGRFTAELAVVLEKKGKFDEAELLLERSVAFGMEELGPEH
ncbi:unnamed protein product, partial [Ectocarpus sp. 13 AM-2016]